MRNVFHGLVVVLATLMFVISVQVLVPEGNWIFLFLFFMSGVLGTLGIQLLKEAE